LVAEDGDSSADATDLLADDEAPSPTGRRDAAVPSSSAHPVRDRLLARAAALRGPPSPEAESEDAPGMLATLEDEIDRVGPPRPPAAPLGGRRAALSPNLVAVFGTLVGLVLVASLVALAMRLDPRRPPDEEPAVASVAPAAKPALPPPVPRRQRKRLPAPWRISDAKGDVAVRIVEGRIGLKPFLRALNEAGVPKKEAYRILRAMSDLHNFDKCDKNDQFFALLARDTSRLKAFEYVVGKEDIFQAREGPNGLLAAKKLDLHIERAQVTGAVQYLGKAFTDDAVRGGFETGLDKALEKAIEGHISLDELERGDVLRVVAQEVTVLGEFSRYAGIEAVEYRPAKGGESTRVYYFRGAKERGYYDQRGRALFEGGWRKPIKDAPITSRFNPKRMHPVLKKIMPHTGTDFGAPSGAPVGASSFGTVSFIGYAGPSGNLVKIDHPGGVETGYAHLSRFAEGLKVGDKVKRMQLVGYVGSTGRSTGPHLHFSAKRNNEFFDAETLNLDSMRVLPAEERAAFADTKRKYDALLDSIALPAPLEAAPAPPAAAQADAAHDDVDLGPDESAPAVAAAVAASAAPAAPAAAAQGAPAPKPAAPAAPAGARPAAVYLSDKELMKLQGVTDNGEISD